MITNLLIESYWLAIGVGIAGLAIWAAGNRRTSPQIKWQGLGVIGLALLLALVSLLIDSDREQVIRRTRQFAAAVEARDWATVESLLHPAVTIGDWQGPADLVKGGKKYAELYGLQAVKLSGLDAQEDPTTGQQVATFSASAELASQQYTGTLPTGWRFAWEMTPAGWTVREIQPRSILGFDSASIAGKFTGRP